MNAVRKGIRDLLLGFDAISALVGDRVYPVLAPKNAALPYITVTLNSLERPTTHDTSDAVSRTYADDMEFVVQAFSKDAEEAGVLFDAIDGALHKRGPVSGEPWFCLLTGAVDVADFLQDDSGSIVFSIATNFEVRRRPA